MIDGKLAPVVRIERTSSGLEAEALPLDDTGTWKSVLGSNQLIVRLQLTAFPPRPRSKEWCPLQHFRLKAPLPNAITIEHPRFATRFC